MFEQPNRWLAACLIIISISTTGCHVFQWNQPIYVQQYETNQPAELFISDQYHAMPPRRIVLMIPRSQENHYELNARLVESLRRHLARLAIYDVVLIAGVCDVTLDSIHQGTFDERRLWEITKRYHADGIMLCEAFSFSAYEPLKLGCSLTFVDTRESIVTMHTSGVWDTTQTNVFKKFQQHVCKVHRCKQYAAGVFLKSPSEFIDFVATDLSERLQTSIAQSVGPPMNTQFDYVGPQTNSPGPYGNYGGSFNNYPESQMNWSQPIYPASPAMGQIRN